MGQNVNYLLGGQSQILGADPELYRQQLIQQEQQRIAAMPPQQGLASALGGLLGRGISNVANDRGFLETTNPVLQKLQKIQGVYDSAMQESDPNDPLSFFTTLQKKFADQGLGQQAIMAATEKQKFEDLGLKTEAAKTAVFKANPAYLDTQIEKARTAGDDKLANQLANQRGLIQVQIDQDRAKEVAQMNLVKAQTEAQKASAARQIADIEGGKTDWKVIADAAGQPEGYAILDKKTKKITYERIGGGEYIPKGATGPAAPLPPAGKIDPSQFDKRVTPPPVPAAPGTTAAPALPTAWNDSTKTYTLAQDPTIQEIKQVAAQNADRLATDAQFREAINRAQNDRIAQIKQQYGNMINIQY